MIGVAKFFKPAIECLVNAPDRTGRLGGRAVLSFLVERHLRGQEVVYECRHYGSGQQIRRQHGEHHSHCQRSEQKLGGARQHQHRNEDDAYAEGRYKSRQRDLLCPVENCPYKCFSFDSHVAVHVLNFHGSIIDEDAYRQSEAAECHHVDRLPEKSEHDEGRQD